MFVTNRVFLTAVIVTHEPFLVSVRVADPWHKQMRALKPMKLVTVQRGIVLSIYFQQSWKLMIHFINSLEEF